MNISIKQIISSKLNLKVCSLIIGYCIWILLNQNQLITITHPIPLYFYGNVTEKKILAPETVSLQLYCKRSDLWSLNFTNLAIHIDSDNLNLGKQTIQIKQNNLFLPESIKLVHYIPPQLTITVEKAEKI
ncbi:MAG: hypothetical protein WDZ41_01700 [Candidatus Babeliales bacterium]